MPETVFLSATVTQVSFNHVFSESSHESHQRKMISLDDVVFVVVAFFSLLPLSFRQGDCLSITCLGRGRHTSEVSRRNSTRVIVIIVLSVPQWGAADAEIKVPSGENTELKRSPFKAWSRSVYSHTCYAYCQGFLLCVFLPFRSIHLYFPKTSPYFSCVGCG